MSIYTKTGDKGFTSLAKLQNISKSDDRIQLLGNIDELTSNIGLVKASETREEVKLQLERIQKNLMTIMAGIADQYNSEFKMDEKEVMHLEEEINRLEDSFPRKKEFIIPGSNVKSAHMDVTRTIARRAERWLNAVDKKYNADSVAKKYMNRLADYLYMLARYTDYLQQSNKNSQINQLSEEQPKMINDEIIQLVLNKLGIVMNRIDLATAKKLISKLEEEAANRGLNAVIAVCGPDGNPMAVHVMDGAYLASFDIAMKKAYTSVALKMSTKQLAELAKPGGSFYGIDKADNGRMIIFGGGVPLMLGDKMVGGLGVSGGTADEDSLLAEYGLSIFSELIV